MSTTKTISFRGTIGLFRGRLLTYLYDAKHGKTYHKMIMMIRRRFFTDSKIINEN